VTRVLLQAGVVAIALFTAAEHQRVVDSLDALWGKGVRPAGAAAVAG